MCVAAEERVECPGLVPPRKKLFVGIAEKPTYVCAGEGEAGDVLGEDHWYGGGEVGPRSLVVTCPHGAHALAAYEEGAGEDEWATGRFRVAGQEGGEGGIDECEAVDVMEVTMFPIPMVDIVFWHSGLWTVKDRRFVHVVPEK